MCIHTKRFLFFSLSSLVLLEHCFSQKLKLSGTVTKMVWNLRTLSCGDDACYSHWSSRCCLIWLHLDPMFHMLDPAYVQEEV